MFKILASYSALSAASAFELDWWSKCDFASVDYSRYEGFPEYIKTIVDKESCIKARGKMFHKCDLNDNFKLDRCEMTYGCFKSQTMDSQAQCLAWADKMSPEYSFVDVVNGCENWGADDLPAVEPEVQPEEPNGLQESAFLTEEQAAEIAGLFPEGTKFTKAFDAAENGWYGSDFHRKMDGVAPTLSIIKATTGYVFGGYTDIPWSTPAGNKFVYGQGNSYMFYFKTEGTSQIQKLGLLGNNLKEVFHTRSYGVSFNGGLSIKDNCHQNTNSYTNLQGKVYDYPPWTANREFAGRAVTGTHGYKFQCANVEVYTVA